MTAPGALAGDARRDFLLRPGEEFGGHGHVFPPGEVPEGPAQVLFAGAALVGDGGVEEVHAQLQRPLVHTPGRMRPIPAIRLYYILGSRLTQLFLALRASLFLTHGIKRPANFEPRILLCRPQFWCRSEG